METTLQKNSVRALLALFCCALWGSAFPCVKTGYAWLQIETTGSQILFAGYRFFLAGMMVFMIACIRSKSIITVQRRAFPHVLSMGFLQTTLQYIFFYIGMSNITGTKGSIINASSSFAAIILAHFLIRDERMNFKKVSGCVLGLLGVILVNLNGIDGSFSFWGEGMIILCTILYGFCSVYTKMISHLTTPINLTAYQLLFGGALLIFAGFLSGGRIEGFDGKSILLLIYMAFISAAGFSIWTALLKYNPVGKVSIFGFSIPIFGVLLSGAILGEQFWALRNLSALLLVSIGIIIVNRQPRFES